MQFLVMYLLLAVIGCIAVSSMVLNFSLEKKFDSNSKTFRGLIKTKEVDDTNNPSIISESKLQSVLDGLEFYKKQSEIWHGESVFWKNAYDNECESLHDLEGRFKKVEKELTTLRYIVGKMDGKRIERDDNERITAIRLVK